MNLETTQIIPPRLAWNRSKLNEFLIKNNIQSQWPKVIDQLPGIIISGIEAGSYNPSIVRHKGKLVMCYRFHPEETFVTCLGIAELDENFNVIHKEVLELNDDSVSNEDGRLFEFKGDLWLSYVSSSWPTFPSATVKHCRLYNPDHWRADNPVEYPYRDRESLEKNHLPIPFNDKLFILYRSNPKQIVYAAESNDEIVSECLHWPYGEIRGGCIVPYQGKLLRFFHSSMRNEMPVNTWRYYVGALLMEAEPPFKMISVSKRPILRGSEIGGDLSRKHSKQNIVFPAGVIEHGGGFALSVGINDSQCAIIKIKESDLNLP